MNVVVEFKEGIRKRNLFVVMLIPDKIPDKELSGHHLHNVM